jgi:hypothetical protein
MDHEECLRKKKFMEDIARNIFLLFFFYLF